MFRYFIVMFRDVLCRSPNSFLLLEIFQAIYIDIMGNYFDYS